jgi:hypothetical protein
VSPRWPDSNLIADALAGYFAAASTERANRYRQFLLRQGAELRESVLTNRAEVEDGTADKLTGFGRWYLANYLRQRGGFDPGSFLAAEDLLRPAAGDVARKFVDWLTVRLPAVSR